MENKLSEIEKLKAGFAMWVGASPGAFEQPGFVLEVVERRSQLAWGENWYQPLWLVRLQETTLCTVTPEHAWLAQAVFGDSPERSLLAPGVLRQAQELFSPFGWQAIEILYSPCCNPPVHPEPDPQADARVIRLGPDHADYYAYANKYSGGVLAILDANRQIYAYAGIKKHGWLSELFIGAQPDQLGDGLGEALVARAVAEISAQGRVPIYVPDWLENAGYASLVRAMGFTRVGEMLLWETQLGRAG
jgi:GNAT superfamily N-acetyltransferase